ncbi:glyoxalase [Sphingomonas oleivorans]|uniref:Glyoxalase n=1 Tax=Sphingomonas oleivorans TaxID=1735121 RepID=A0A2T5G268_9SPHN|nr:VOC family protein [Sphingomonas oleivorans]PTQ13211.1 glyoxalase [Sphingomonas oleivorans]
MIHHVSVGTNDIGRARAFYDPVLSLLGVRLLAENGKSADYGVGEILFSVETPIDGRPASAGNGVHIAFQARDRAMVREFHRLALAHGGTDEGVPGVRPEYDAHYFGAFVRDPDGNKIEAVTFSAK